MPKSGRLEIGVSQASQGTASIVRDEERSYSEATQTNYREEDNDDHNEKAHE